MPTHKVTLHRTYETTIEIQADDENHLIERLDDDYMLSMQIDSEESDQSNMIHGCIAEINQME